MNVINEIAFFFQSFGRFLEVLGAVLMIGLPVAGLSFWLGWLTRKGREPADVTKARDTRKDADAMIAAMKASMTRSRRLFESADTDEMRAADILVGARAQRRLGVELLAGNADFAGFIGPRREDAEAE